MGERKKVPDDVVADVLAASRRRCCICFAVRDDVSEKKGQIAHLDRNPSNSDPDNLAFFCLEHHDEYDSRPSQSKGLTLEEVKRYRAVLHQALAANPSAVAIPPDVRVRASAALTSVQLGVAEAVLAIGVENHSTGSVFIRSICIELSDSHELFFQRDYITRELNTRRELRPGESFAFHVSLHGLFSDGRGPHQFLGILAVDDINGLFRFAGEEFKKIIEALYAEHLKVREGAT